MKPLRDYTLDRERSFPVRIFQSDKPRLEELQRRLTVASGGLPFSQSQVVRYLLDLAEQVEQFKADPLGLTTASRVEAPANEE